ncbi:MAG: hypothetical protein HRU11_06620 [Parvularculaceae bacterium]|nr:hypothetical protein [Parvularculaceae bacterium]
MARSHDAAVAQVAALGYSITGEPEEAEKGSSMFSMFPLLAISFVIYAALAYTMGSEWTSEVLFSITMVSDTIWNVSGGDVFLVVSFGFLFLEIIRSTGTGNDSIFNHVFSSLLFIGAFFCFLMLAPFATSTFFLLAIMMLVDMLAGFWITVGSARRDFGVS